MHRQTETVKTSLVDYVYVVRIRKSTAFVSQKRAHFFAVYTLKKKKKPIGDLSSPGQFVGNTKKLVLARTNISRLNDKYTRINIE